MKKKQYKYLKFYHECMASGKIPKENGICGLFRGDQLFELFIPDYEERPLYTAYWAHDASEEDYENGTDDFRSEIRSSFVPCRQTIVLLMAAMNGEL